MKSINENIQTARAAPRLVVYTNQSETHPTGWAHGWVPHSIQPRTIFTAVTSRSVSGINASNKVLCMVSDGFQFILRFVSISEVHLGNKFGCYRRKEQAQAITTMARSIKCK